MQSRHGALRGRRIRNSRQYAAGNGRAYQHPLPRFRTTLSPGRIRMETLRLRRRFWPEAGLAKVSLVLANVTLVWKDWIEIVFGAEPDGGSGALEWTVVGFLLILALALGVVARI